jgi:hypothetical protein
MRSQRFSTVTRVVSAVTLLAVASCASTTMIQSQPPGAKVFLNGEPVGVTPYAMTDTKIVGSTTMVRLEAPGYEPLNGVIARNEEFDVGACIGGVFVLFPFLWIMGYKPVHTFELHPLGGGAAPLGYAPPAGYPPAGAAPAYTPPPGAAPPH